MKRIAYFILGVIGLLVLLGILGAIIGSNESEPSTPFTVDSVGAEESAVTIYPSSPHYETIRELISSLEPDWGSMYMVSAELFQEINDILGPLPEEEQERLRLWKEHNEHRDNLQELEGTLESFWGDKSFNDSEAQYMCAVVPTWESIVQEALDFMEEFRRVDPELVTETPRLINLENSAIAKASFIDDLINVCASIGLGEFREMVTSTPESKTPRVLTPTPDWLNMTEEEKEAEFSKNPCYHGKGPLGHIWDTECLVRQP